MIAKIVLLTILLFSFSVNAQQAISICVKTVNSNGGTTCIPISSTAPLPVIKK